MAPLLLCLVCSSWRDIVLQSASLWSKITIDITDLLPKPATGSQHPVSPVTKFLGHSRNWPLSIRLTANLISLFDQSDWKVQLDTIFGRVHSRTRELNLSSPWLSNYFHTFHSDIQFPQLDSIRVTAFGGPLFDTLPKPLTAFAHSTLLRKLDYAAYISYETALNLAVPWEQLTHITLTDVDFASWIYIFPRCTNMQSGSFVISGSPLPSPKPYAEITFPSLTYLAIHNMQSSRSPLSLEGYSFPNLRELMLEWNLSGFDTKFLSTIKHLQKLIISSPERHFVNMADVLSIFGLTPFVAHLHLLHDCCSSELFEALTYHAYQQRPLLPYLRVLEVEKPPWSAIHSEEAMVSLKKMLSSRRWIFPSSKIMQLEILQMTTGVYDPVVVRETLQQLVATGLQLKYDPATTAMERRGGCQKLSNQ
ncbi:hypothetical protein D9756_005307 [Leucocoprinus leucothites]|uniref:F-box domain-containing protein n=1 Tax=Leucocoprinus leucothites TaxID=201217 RepID=A0A8H5D743_9AGAR|nr:hypothetical protein D9756_005307 [Leucoagaricus leucothites]